MPNSLSEILNDALADINSGMMNPFEKAQLRKDIVVEVNKLVETALSRTNSSVEARMREVATGLDTRLEASQNASHEERESALTEFRENSSRSMRALVESLRKENGKVVDSLRTENTAQVTGVSEQILKAVKKDFQNATNRMSEIAEKTPTKDQFNELSAEVAKQINAITAINKGINEWLVDALAQKPTKEGDTISDEAAETLTRLKLLEDRVRKDLAAIEGKQAISEFPQGLDGQDGSTWYDGTGAPERGLGVNNDYYIDSSTSEYYKKIDGAWFLRGTLVGGSGGTSVVVDDSEAAGIYSDLTGAVDGTNTTFVTSAAYTKGTLEVELDGVAKKGSDITETAQWTGTFDMVVAPASGVYIKARYAEGSDTVPAPAFAGTISDMTATDGTAMTPFDASTYFSTGGAPTSYSLTNAPSWMSISSVGVITGTPDAIATTSGITVTGTNALGSATSNTWSMDAQAAVTLALEALTYDATTFELLGVKTGTVSLTATHSTTQYAPDKDGVYQQYAANAAVWSGGRVALTGGAGTVVTNTYADDGAGTPLATVPKSAYYTGATNSQTYSRDCSSWTAEALVTATADQVGIDGTTNTAWTLDEQDASGIKHIDAPSFGSGTNTPATVVLWIKKDASATHYPSITINIQGVGSSDYQINLITGAYTTTNLGPTDNYNTEMIDDGDWWKFLVNHATGGGSTTILIRVYPANGTVWGSFSSATTGSFVMGQAEIHTNKTISEIRKLPPIFTTTASVSTVGIDPLAIPVANHSDTDGLYYLEWTPSYSTADVSGNQVILSLDGGAGLLYYDATAGAFKSTDGTNTASVTKTIVKDTTYLLALTYHAGDAKMQVSVDATDGTETTYDGGFTTTGDLEMAAGGSYTAGFADLRKYSIGSQTEGYTQRDLLLP